MRLDINSRISGPAIEAFQALSGDLQRDVVSFLEENHRKHLYSLEDVVNAWLVWNGIIGYTPQIVRLVQQAYKE